jgi:hypothetical protein
VARAGMRGPNPDSRESVGNLKRGLGLCREAAASCFVISVDGLYRLYHPVWPPPNFLEAHFWTMGGVPFLRAPAL